MKIKIQIVMSVFLLSLGICPLAWAAKTEKIMIAVQPTSTPEQLSLQARELEDFLAKELGQEVEIMFPTTYAGVIESLRFGHAQVAFMGAWPALLATKHAKARVILAEIRDVIIEKDNKEMPYYYSYCVVPKASPHSTLQDLKGKRVAFSSPMSTSGYVAPLAKLVELELLTPQDGKVDPRNFFGEVFFAGGYAQAWEALKAGQVDAAIIAGDVAQTLYNEVLANTKILESQGPIPSHVVVIAAQADKDFESKIVNAFLKLNNPEYQNLMKKFISGIFIRFEPATDAHLKSLDHMLQLTGMEYKEKGK